MRMPVVGVLGFGGNPFQAHSERGMNSSMAVLRRRNEEMSTDGEARQRRIKKHHFPAKKWLCQICEIHPGVDGARRSTRDISSGAEG
jgi:hypothetical protein